MEWYRNLDGTAEVRLFWNEESDSNGEYLIHTYDMYVNNGFDLLPIAGYRYVEKDNAFDNKVYISMRAIEVKATEKPSFGRWVESESL